MRRRVLTICDFIVCGSEGVTLNLIFSLLRELSRGAAKFWPSMANAIDSVVRQPSNYCVLSACGTSNF